MLIHRGVAFHNVAELHPLEDGSLRAQRLPEALRPSLNDGAKNQCLGPANSEIRFVLGEKPVRLTLSGARSTLFYGPFQTGKTFTGQKQTIEIGPPERLYNFDAERMGDLSFSPRVCRLLFGESSPLIVHDIDAADARLPEPAELPDLRMLAYGTSITHGYTATLPHLNYAAQTATRLGADLINLGLAGACHCEPELADHIAARRDWDFATLALSVNMVGCFSVEQFYERVSYMVNTVAGADHRRPVACITIYPHTRDLTAVEGEEYSKTAAFRDALRRAVRECPHPNVSIFEGPEILRHWGGLTADLVHPGDNGMIEMGENLARLLAPTVRQLRLRR